MDRLNEPFALEVYANESDDLFAAALVLYADQFDATLNAEQAEEGGWDTPQPRHRLKTVEQIAAEEEAAARGEVLLYHQPHHPRSRHSRAGHHAGRRFSRRDGHSQPRAHPHHPHPAKGARHIKWSALVHSFSDQLLAALHRLSRKHVSGKRSRGVRQRREPSHLVHRTVHTRPVRPRHTTPRRAAVSSYPPHHRRAHAAPLKPTPEGTSFPFPLRSQP